MKAHHILLNINHRYDEYNYVNNVLVSQNIGVVFDTNKTIYDDKLAFTSVSTPGYRHLNRYQLPEQPHTLQKWIRVPGRSEQSYRFESTSNPKNWSFTRYYGSGLMSGVNVEGGLYAGEDPTYQAISRLQKVLAQSSGSALVSMAEANKTARMVADTASRLARAYRALRKGHLGIAAAELDLVYTYQQKKSYRSRYFRERKHGGDMSQFAANQWLAMSYGWKPLLQDVYSQAENLGRVLTERQGVLIEAKASAKTRWAKEEFRTGSPNFYRVRVKNHVENSVRYTVRYKVPSGFQDPITAFGLNNPALVAWELIPFSFVADWFLPIGNYLENLTAYAGLTFHSGVKVSVRLGRVRDSLERTGPQFEISGGVKKTLSALSGGGYQDDVTKTRTVLAGFPYQDFPSFKDPRSFAHAASAIALIQSVFRGSARLPLLKR